MMNRYNSGVWLSNAIGNKAKKYLPDDCKKLIFDWVILDEVIKSNLEETSFYDWSFAMAPMYKAVESVLWKIATQLGIVKNDKILGNFFDESNIEHNIDKITEKVINEDKLLVVKNQLSELKTFLKRYRHMPAHYGNKFNSYSEAKIAAKSALHNIKCLVDDLLDIGLIKLPKIAVVQSEQQIDIDEIPF